MRIIGVTLRDGNLESTGDSGGAVRIEGDGDYSVAFSQCRITDNRGLYGGGVYAEGADGTLWVVDCLVANNDSTGAGCTALMLRIDVHTSGANS